ncbi:hypothetical protein CLOL250_01258 [Clostridium sp. L2-50]|nr:hypothetical protein CLOL250_01258 [Clostridium sp. L2-50]
MYQKKICFGRSFFDVRKWVKVNYQGNVMVFIENRLPMERCADLCHVRESVSSSEW